MTMIRRSVLHLSLISILGFVTRDASAQASSRTADLPYGPRFKEMTNNLSAEELSLLEEYRLQFSKLRAVYENCKVVAMNPRSVYPPMKSPANPKGQAILRRTYRARDSRFFRMDVETLDWQTEEPTGRLTIHVVGPEGIFTARKPNAESGLAISQVYSDANELLRRDFSLAEFYNAPYADGTEKAILGYEDEWQTDEVKSHVENGIRLATVTLTAPPGDKDEKHVARFEFLRDQAWALRSYAYGVPEVNMRHGLLEYAGEKDGVPLLKRLVMWQESGATKKRAGEEEYTITSFLTEAPLESEFLPAAIGLALGKARVNWWPRVFVLVLGIVLIVVYVRLKRRVPAT
jgi:hypothetical protein